MTTTTVANEVRNGVDVTALRGTVEAIEETPAIAEFQFRADNRWIDGAHNRTTVQGFFGAMEEHTSDRKFEIDADEPPLLLGLNRGANPVEHLLNALAGCLTTTLVYHAAAHGVEITSVRSHLEGDLDLRDLLGMPGAERNGFRQIRVSFDVKGKATPEQIEELIQLAQARSPVFDMVTNGVEVVVSQAK